MTQKSDEAPNDGDTLHISNIPKDFTEENLKKLFSIYGNVCSLNSRFKTTKLTKKNNNNNNINMNMQVVSVSIPKDPRTAIGRGFGFVCMETPEEAAKSIQGIQTTYPDYSVELVRSFFFFDFNLRLIVNKTLVNSREDQSQGHQHQDNTSALRKIAAQTVLFFI